MGIEMSDGISCEGDDRVGERAESFDDSLAAGRHPIPVQADDHDGLSAFLAVQDTLRMLERVWPRSVRMGPAETESQEPGDSGPAPETFGRFRIIRELGRGGFGVVFLAIDPDLGRPVALKVPRGQVLLDPESRRRFVREARAAAGLDHPNLVPLYEAGEVGPVCYLASAYCEGPTLAAWLRDHRDPVPPRLAAQLLAPLADAMQHAHDRGILHRDLKPSNILLHRPGADRRRVDGVPEREREPAPGVTKRWDDRGCLGEHTAPPSQGGDKDLAASRGGQGRAGEFPGHPYQTGEKAAVESRGELRATIESSPTREGGASGGSASQAQVSRDSDSELIPRIIDFGLARLMDPAGEETTASFAAMGSAPYMAPEQVEGKRIGPATDVYGLGTILYSVLCRRAPHRGANDLDTARRVVAEEPIPPRRRRAGIPRDLEAICLKCLEKDPARRYRSARDLADDLGRFLAGEPTKARPVSAPARAWRALRRRPARLASLALIGVLALVGLVGARWYEDRLDNFRRIARERDEEARARDAANRPHLQYARDIRQAAQSIRTSRPGIALELLMQHRPNPGEDDLREFAWHHLLRRCHTELRTLPGHRGEVYYVEFSPRGDLLASAGRDGVVLIWSTGSWEPVRKIEASRTEVNVAAFSPDGKTLATVDDDGMLKLWETATGRCQMERPAHNRDAVIARFTADGKTIITGGRKDGFIKLWDRSTGNLMHTLRASQSDLENAVLSPDESILAMAAEEVKLYKFSNRTLITSLNRHGGAQGLAFSHDGTIVASATQGDWLVHLWETSTRRPRLEFQGHTAGVFSVAFSPDNRTIISAGDDGTIRFWSVADGTQRGAHLGHTGRIWNLALSPDGRTIASAGRDGTVKLWESEPPRNHLKLPVPEPALVGFATDGRNLLTLESSPSSSQPGRGWMVARWDAHSGSLLGRTMLDQMVSLRCAAFSRDGRSLAIATCEGAITLWNTASGRRQGGFDPSSDTIDQLQFSPDDRSLLVHDGQRGVSLWDLSSRIKVDLSSNQSEEVLFTPTAELITVGRDGDFSQWDPRAERPRRSSSRQPHLTWLPTLSADGQTLATIDPMTHKIHAWSAKTFEHKAELSGHPGNPTVLALTPHGRTLASAGADGTVKLWDVASGEELLTLEGCAGPASMLRFSPDGKTLAALNATVPGRPNEIILWRTAEGERDLAKNAEVGPIPSR